MPYATRRRRQRRPAQPKRCTTCSARLVLLRVANGRYLPFNADPVSMPDDGSFPDHAYPTYGREAWGADALIAELQATKGLRLEAAIARVRDLPWHRKHGCAPRRAQESSRERETTDR